MCVCVAECDYVSIYPVYGFAPCGPAGSGNPDLKSRSCYSRILGDTETLLGRGFTDANQKMIDARLLIFLFIRDLVLGESVSITFVYPARAAALVREWLWIWHLA